MCKLVMIMINSPSAEDTWMSWSSRKENNNKHKRYIFKKKQRERLSGGRIFSLSNLSVWLFLNDGRFTLVNIQSVLFNWSFSGSHLIASCYWMLLMNEWTAVRCVVPSIPLLSLVVFKWRILPSAKTMLRLLAWDTKEETFQFFMFSFCFFLTFRTTQM